MIPPNTPFASVQGTLALQLTAPPTPPVPTRARPGCDLVEVDEPTRRSVQQWAAKYTQVALEAIAGDRPLAQIAPVTTGRLMRELQRRSRLITNAYGHPAGVYRLRTVTPRSAVARVSVSFIEPGTVEACLTIRHGARIGAAALRMEFQRERWIATDLELALRTTNRAPDPSTTKREPPPAHRDIS
jgi:hypothetical protein